MRLATLVSGFILVIGAQAAMGVPAPGTEARYRVLSAEAGAAAPFSAVTVTYGPAGGDGIAWQLAVWVGEDTQAGPQMQLRAVTQRDPLAVAAEPSAGASGSLAKGTEPLRFVRYQLAVPANGEVLEYQNVHTHRALLPSWTDFERHFVPRVLPGGRAEQGIPHTCAYLGHVLTLEKVTANAEWPEWGKVAVLPLDPELLIGTSRSFRDAEGHRLPQQPERHDYRYVPFDAGDFRSRIDAGMNLFCVTPEQEPYVRDEPVFYIRGAGGKPPLRYPVDLYRSNYAGNEMFMDEPTCIMIGDKRVHTTLKYFSDAAALITGRTRSGYAGPKGQIYGLERDLRSNGVSFGDMRLLDTDFPSWETVYETAYYQLAGGLAGFVHEGRYQLDEFNANARASTGIERVYTAEEMFRYTYAFLRGAARHFGKDWGMSIYGQADPKLSPLALSMAYDRGARYLWYWTSDHDHHLPWPEQIELTKAIRQHAGEHPRRSIRETLPTLDKVILIPYGYFLTLESGTQRKAPWDLWWAREMDAEGKNEASQRYQRLVHNAFVEVNKALDEGEDFDICVDDGREVKGYRQVVRVGVE